MKKTILARHLVLVLLVIGGFTANSQGTLEDYKRAEKFMHFNVNKLTQNLYLSPNLIDKSNDFWYRTQIDNGHKFILVKTSKGTSADAFNHEKLAKALAKKLEKEFKADSLPFRYFKFEDKRKAITFQVDTLNFKYSLKSAELKVVEKKEEKRLPKNESKSPDGKWIAFVKEYNLYLRNVESGEETQLTTDGVEQYDYATPLSWYNVVDESVGDKYDPAIYVDWSPNSKKFVATKLDRRDNNKLYMLQWLPKEGMRAKIWSYERSLPGEELDKEEYFIFDVESKSKTKVDLEPREDIWAGVGSYWTEDASKYVIPKMTRYYKAIDLYFADPETGKVENIIHEDAKTMIEYQMVGCKLINNGEKIVWMSERDGWSHLYLYDGKTKELINQVTKGEFVVRSIEDIDEENEVIYFMAGGREEGRDPYYRHLYKVNYDGSGLTLLTPEDAEHDVRISSDKKYFLDNFSRVDLKSQAVLRRLSDGKLVMKLQEANIDKLLETGWKYPERFVVKGRDGETDIYGVMFYPSNFDPNKKYPILDNTYSGPQAVNTSKTFRRGIWNDAQPLAEAGFIVIKVDGMGTAMRSKAFHDYSYENLGDIGAPDHIAAIKQLAEKYSFIDAEKAGIYGFSAGGYDAAHALLKHGDFYKVGVAAAGNHDQRMAKAWWPEQYMGAPGDQYEEQSNLSIVDNLTGKLLLVHGDMDNNVNPACTYRLAAKLVEANKDFDLLIIPNNDHSQLWHNKYFIRKRMDYFVQHLLGVTPPKEFKFIEY